MSMRKNLTLLAKCNKVSFLTEMITNSKLKKQMTSLEEKYVRVYKRLEEAEKCNTNLIKVNKGKLLLIFISQDRLDHFSNKDQRSTVLDATPQINSCMITTCICSLILLRNRPLSPHSFDYFILIFIFEIKCLMF